MFSKRKIEISDRYDYQSKNLDYPQNLIYQVFVAYPYFFRDSSATVST